MTYNPDNRRSKKEQPLGDVIEKLMKAYKLDDKMKEYDLNDAWPELMGKAVAFRTKSIKIKNKTQTSKTISKYSRIDDTKNVENSHGQAILLF